MKSLFRVSLVGALAILLAVSFSTFSQQQPSNSKTLLLDTISQPETLDPAWSFFTADSEVIEQMYEHLVDYKGGSTGEFTAELATEVPTVENKGISADGLTYTFNLRSGIKFWDGTDLTCADAEYSFERVMVMDRDSGPALLLLSPLLGIIVTRDSDGKLLQKVTVRGKEKTLAQAINDAVECKDNQVIFHLNTAFPPFLQLMAHSSVGSIYSKAFTMKNGGADNKDFQKFLEATNNPKSEPETTLYDKAMATGPYRLQAWDRAGEQIILGSHKAYRSGPAALENVIWSNVPEFSTRLLRISKGDADTSYLSTRAQVAQLKDAKPKGVRLIEYLPGFVVETIHMGKEIIQVGAGNEYVGSGKCDGNGIPSDFLLDIHARRGFAAAFSQGLFIKDFLLGAGVAAATPIPPIIEFVDPSVKPFEFDLAKTEAEFKQAKCTGSTKSIWETGFKFTATFNAGNARRQAAVEQLKFHIESLNAKRQGLPPFSISVVAVPGAIFFNPTQQRKTPMYAGGWSPDFIDIDNWIRQWMDPDGNFGNVTGLSALGDKAKEWAKLLNEAIQTVDKAKRKAIYSQIQKDYIEYAVAITMPNRTLDEMERTWVDGNYYNPAEGDPQSPPNIYALSKKADGKPNLAELKPYNPTITEF